MYTNIKLRKFGKLEEKSRKQVELGKGNEFSKTDELIDDTDVDEEQPDLTTAVFCVILTEELDVRSTFDSEAGGSLEQSEVINAMTSDRVQDRYVDQQLNTGGKGIDEFQRIKKGDIRNSNVWSVERHSEWDRRLSVIVRARVLDKNVIPFL